MKQRELISIDMYENHRMPEYFPRFLVDDLFVLLFD
jgi:hypothetical protein